MFKAEMNYWNTLIRKQIRTEPDFNLLEKVIKFQEYLRDAMTFPAWKNERTPEKHPIKLL